MMVHKGREIRGADNSNNVTEIGEISHSKICEEPQTFRKVHMKNNLITWFCESLRRSVLGVVICLFF